jgi:hypothetical protein
MEPTGETKTWSSTRGGAGCRGYWEKSIVLRMHESVQRTYVTPKQKNKNLRDSPRLHVSVDPQEFNSLLLNNLVDNGSI